MTKNKEIKREILQKKLNNGIIHNKKKLLWKLLKNKIC